MEAMEIRIVREPVSVAELKSLAAGGFGDLVKAVVDAKRGVMALGGQLHADGESLLLDDGSSQDDLWGLNIYPSLPRGERVEFDSVINIRPSRGHRSRGVDDEALRQRLLELVEGLIRD